MLPEGGNNKAPKWGPCIQRIYGKPKSALRRFRQYALGFFSDAFGGGAAHVLACGDRAFQRQDLVHVLGDAGVVGGEFGGGQVGQVAAEIRAYRGPEPYKGKGVRYSDEFIFRKEGKKK